MQDPHDPTRTLSEDDVTELARRDMQQVKQVFNRTPRWRAPFSGSKRRKAALNELIAKSENYTQAGETGAAFVMAEAVVQMAGRLPATERSEIVSSGLRSMQYAARETYLTRNDYGSAQQMFERTVELSEQLGSAKDVGEAFRKQSAFEEQARAEGAANSTNGSTTQPSRNTSSPTASEAPVSAEARQTLNDIAVMPASAIAHAEQFFATAQQAAVRDPGGQTVNKTADVVGGGQVIDKMLQAAEFLRSSDPKLAFETVHRAQELAVQNLPDGAARTALREKSFMAMGRIAALTGDEGNTQLANEMYEFADKAAGPIYRNAVARGVSATMSPAHQAMSRVNEVEAARQAGIAEGLRAAGRQTAAEPVGLNVAADGYGVPADRVIRNGAQTSNGAQPDPNRARLNPISSGPVFGTQQPGLLRRLGRNTWKVVKVAAVGYGLVLAAQSASVHVLGNKESSLLGTTVTATRDYKSLQETAAWGQVLTNQGAGLPATIGMPQVATGANPAAQEGAIKLAEQRGAASAIAQRNKQDASRAGIVTADMDRITGEVDAWRKQHPAEFAQVRGMLANDVAGALAKMNETAPAQLNRDMTNLLASDGIQGFRTPINSAYQNQIREERAAGASKPRPASGPGARP